MIVIVMGFALMCNVIIIITVIVRLSELKMPATSRGADVVQQIRRDLPPFSNHLVLKLHWFYIH